MTSAKKIMNELRKLTPREKQYIFEFMRQKSGDKALDYKNFEFDLEVNRFRNAVRLKRLFELMYPLKDYELSKLAKAVGM